MKITFDKKNYRKHSEQNKKRIRKSLTECGAGRSVLVDKDGCLIAGNGVFEQAEKMGIKPLLDNGVKFADGYQLRYIKLLSDDCRLNCERLSFDEIDAIGAGMLRGEKVTRESRHKKKRCR